MNAHDIIRKYNTLQGKTLKRNEIRALIRLAKKTGVTEIVNKLVSLLRQFPSVKSFEFTRVTPVKYIEDFDALGIPELLPDLEEELGTDETSGLNKVFNSNDVYKMVTNKVIKMIEAGVDRWDARHSAGNISIGSFISSGIPFNFGNKKAYRGINIINLSFYPKYEGKVKSNGEFEVDGVTWKRIEDGRMFWMTMKQIGKFKGVLKKGSKANQAVFYKWLFFYNRKQITEERYKYLEKKYGCSPLNFSEDCSKLNKIPILRYYSVFNERDIEGIDFDKYRKKKTEMQDEIKTEQEKVLAGDLIIKNMPKKPKMIIGRLSDRESPHYSPGFDKVVLPLKEQYREISEWYGTAFHELIHSTGHKKRLGRFENKDYKMKRWGDNAYALEELVAELGASFMNAESGILLNTLKNNAAYIKGWAKAVKKELIKDNKAIFKASGQAQKAVDFILNRNKEGVPAYWDEYMKIKKEIRVKGKEQKAKRKTECTKDDVIKHLRSMEHIDFANDYAYILSEDLDKVIAWVGDNKVYNRMVKRLAEKICDKPVYLDVVGFKKKTESKKEKLVIENHNYNHFDLAVNKTYHLITIRFKKNEPKEVTNYMLNSHFNPASQLHWQQKYTSRDDLGKEKDKHVKNLKRIYELLEKKDTGNIINNETIQRLNEEFKFDKVTSFRSQLEKIIGGRIDNDNKKHLSHYTEAIKMFLEQEKFAKLNKKQAIELMDFGHLLIDPKPVRITRPKKLSFRERVVMLVKEVAGNDLIRPVMMNVLHDGDYLVGTDAHALSVIEARQFEKEKNVMYDKTGKKAEITGTYPNYKAVIPKDNRKIGTFGLKELIERLKAMGKVQGSIEHFGYAGVIVDKEKKQNIFFEPAIMLRSLMPLYRNGVKTVDLKVGTPNRAILFEDTEKFNQIALTMPRMVKDDEHKIVTVLHGNYTGGGNGLKGMKQKSTGQKQLALFGPAGKQKRKPAKKKSRKTGLNSISPKPIPVKPVRSGSGLVTGINHVEKNNRKFVISGDIGTFLGDIEIKPVGSVACTLDAPQGAGKTRFLFQIMNELARNYRILFISLEEHPQSNLFRQKVDQYIAPERQGRIDTIGELERGREKAILDELIPNYDIIMIDSWNKIYEASRLDFDNDLRKAYNGKLIFAIFQRTVTGTIRGGAKSQFDGDIIMKIKKGETFKENYVYHDKNRYQSRDLTGLHYNIYYKNLTGEAQNEVLAVDPVSNWDDAVILI